MDTTFKNWHTYMESQIGFYKTKKETKRKDNDFIWNWYNFVNRKNTITRIKAIIKKILKSSAELDWFDKKSELLFNSRQILEDEYSKMQFDLYILLKVVGHNRFYFPRSYFDEFISIHNEGEFTYNLPKDYAGFPLNKYELKLNTSGKDKPVVSIVTYKEMIILLNKWRQYFIQRGNLNMIPSKGDIVLDCGSCIGDTAILFAACVGKGGEVHTFDPVPLHNSYVKVQAELNPLLKNVLHINTLAIGDKEQETDGNADNLSIITPGGNILNNFSTTTIDIYCERLKIKNVNYIKMDIEGAEADALRGGSKIIARDKPKLAISSYHKREDLWEIPILIKKINPNYKIYFEHHLPIQWEACFYAE